MTIASGAPMNGVEPTLNQGPVGKLFEDKADRQHGQDHAPTHSVAKGQAGKDVFQVGGKKNFVSRASRGLADQSHQYKPEPVGAQVGPEGAELETEVRPTALSQAALDEQVNERYQGKDGLVGGQEPHTQQGHSGDEDGFEQNGFGFHEVSYS